MTMSPAPAASPPTYVVELTPPGRGAVAVVLAAGPVALHAVGAHFLANSGRQLNDLPRQRIAVGRWGGLEGEELVVCRRSADQVEIHCHGGIAAVRAVIDALVANGCCEIDWRAWLHCSSRVSPKLGTETRSDATTREAHIALANTVTARAAAILVDQLNGALSATIHEILALIEKHDWPRAASLADQLWAWRAVGLHLSAPWRVVFAGPPNVGKSSLMNALAGFERAIVSPDPGTTRDIITLSTAIDGWPVQLTDTAGLRESTEEIESAGVALAIRALDSADLVVLVEDATQPLPPDVRLLPPLRSPLIRVRNKIDLLLNSRIAPGDTRDSVPFAAIETCALDGFGIAALADAIGNQLVPNPPQPGAAVPFTKAQVKSLALVRLAIERQHAAAAGEALHSMLASTDT